MQQHLKTFFSNRTEILFEHLKDTLFQGTSPLSKRIVVVPSPAMKSWLTLQLAKDPQITIAAGIDIGLVEPSMRKICQAVGAVSDLSQNAEPSEMELALALESSIHDIARLPPQQLSDWQPLIHYLGNTAFTEKKHSRKTTGRISSLAAELAKTFIDYGLFGENIIDAWEQEGFKGWQQKLWQKMESLFSIWNYPSRKVRSLTFKEGLKPQNLQIHLFGLSYIPPLYFRFLHKISKHIPVNYYLLSPCQKFWGDLLSQKEGARLRNYWKAQEAPVGSQEALDSLLRDSNPLLANLGKVGREMSNILCDSEAETAEQYCLPESSRDHPEYRNLMTDDLHLIPSSHPLTLLEALQADMVLLRNPEAGRKLPFSLYDGTIQVHAAPKKVREVEAIYDLILDIIDRHARSNDPILPGDILVMAPDISTYLPHIHSVFKCKTNLLDVQLMEPHSAMEHEVVKGFVHLLSLAKGRWEATAFLRLLEVPSFRRKLNIDLDDVNIIQSWIKETNIFWGSDDNHRREIWNRDYACDTSRSAVGTWEHGLGQILDSLVFKADKMQDGAASVHGADLSKATLLGKVISTLRSLRKDFALLTNGSKMRLHEWSIFLHCLFDAYLTPYDAEGSLDGYHILKEQIAQFEKAAERQKDALFTFDMIWRHLERNLKRESSFHRENNLNAVKFSSLLPMRTVPAKVIVLMGMGDGEFPRARSPNAWNLLNGNPSADYCPEKDDFDRYLFLEAILSARKYLIFSYVSQEPDNLKEIGPSLLIKETLNYLDTAFAMMDSPPSDRCRFKHALDPFNSKYFHPESPIKSHSIDDYKASIAYHRPERQQAHSFIKSYTPPIRSASLSLSEQTVDLSDLIALVKNPSKAFLKEMGIYIDSLENRMVPDEGEVLLTSLDRWKLMRESLQNCPESAIKRAEISGMLPQGTFHKVEKEKFLKEITEIDRMLKSLGTSKEEVFPIIFNDRQNTCTRTKEGYFTPPLTFQCNGGSTVKLVGKIDLATTKGLLLQSDNTLDKNIGQWPAILAYACLIKQHGLQLEPQAFFLKKLKAKPIDFHEPEAILLKLIAYYLETKGTPSPLTADQIKNILQNKMDAKQSRQKGYHEDWRSSAEKWMERNASQVNSGIDNEYWKAIAMNAFYALPKHWHPRSLNKSGGGDDADV